MRLPLLLGSVLFATVALPLSACGGSDDDVNDERAGVGTGDPGDPAEPADPVEPADPADPGGGEDPPAEPPPEDCSGVLALCIEGTAWSVEACACVPGTPCGPSVCAEGEVCCNESCGICAPPDGVCTQQFCGEEPPPEEPPPDCSGTLALCIEGTAWSVEACACVPGTPCGPSVCAEGEVCCNESCGICTPPDGFCTDQLCEAPAGDCATDEDCALVENYCGGCNCLALPDTADAPTCEDPVNCFAPACLNKRAACVEGSCTVVDE